MRYLVRWIDRYARPRQKEEPQELVAEKARRLHHQGCKHLMIERLNETNPTYTRTIR
jgi:hypothetical protein